MDEIRRTNRARIVHKATASFHAGQARPALRRVPHWIVDAVGEDGYQSRTPLELTAWRRAARKEADRIRQMQDEETNRYDAT